MKTKFYHSAVHKNIQRERVYRAFTKLGVKKLKAAFEDAKLRLKHRRELTGDNHHE
ncbi:hypothetical protein QE177_04455 [Arsenophonus sp. aPb]|uniref:hypothetical protein n=1 Tax=Arsenophonus sp. aPb TaxID=3041619 RepID=UPI002469435B|nr:hypothetical protein [Arsenophonus sp. aPb]WGL99138.1 hypothetical protein QE177_04455 [Arsenophonus sp. aPb]